MQVWLGVHLVRPGLDAYRHSMSDPQLIVLHQGKVWACGGQAWQAGVRPGMRQAGARALAPEACFMNRDLASEKQLREELELALLPYTPMLAWKRDDALVLDISASLALFGGLRRLYAQVRDSLRQLGVAVRLALAPSASGAWLLARAGQAARRRILRPSRLAMGLDGLSLALLDGAGPHLSWLESLGCRTLGAVRRLPRDGLRQRQADTLLAQLDQAYGVQGEWHEWVRPPEHFRSQVLSLFAVERHDALCWLARRLLVQLQAWLDVRQQAVTELRWSLHHERRQQAGPRTHFDLKLAQPAWEPEHLLRLLAERLARSQLAAPVNAVTLEVLACQARPGGTGNLLAEPGAAGDAAALQDVLAARLGAGNILRASPVADHRPERACRWLPCQGQVGGPPAGSGADGGLAAGAAMLPDRAQRPFWLLETAQLLPMAGEQPVHAGAVLRLLAGPERIEDGWWDGGVARDYFIAEHEASGVRYWVYRQRQAGLPGMDMAWFLHGFYA